MKSGESSNSVFKRIKEFAVKIFTKSNHTPQKHPQTWVFNCPIFNLTSQTLVEKAMAPHSSTLAWKIPWTEEPGRLQSLGSLRVCHERATSLSLLTFHALEKEMATHSSVLAWRIPGTGEPGGLPSMGSHRVGHHWSDLAAAAAQTLGLPRWLSEGSVPGSGRSPGGEMPNPLQYSCLGYPMDGEALWATVHGVAKSWTWLSS